MLGLKDAFSRRGRAVLIVLSLALALLTTIVVITAGSSISAEAADATVAAGATLATPPTDLPAVPPGAVASAGLLQLGFAMIAAMTADIEGTVYPGAGEVALAVLAAAAVAGLLAALPVLARRRRSLAHALAIE